MKSHLADARPARPRMAFALLATIAATVIAFLPTVLTTAAATSATKTVTAAPTASYGIWSDSSVPPVPSSADAKSVTLGLVFSSAASGRLRGVQYYAAGDNRVATTGWLWNSSGRRIASVTFPATSTDGWKTAWLSSPARIRAGERYTVSYRAPNGHYARQSDVFVDGRTLSANSLTAHRGTFTYGTGRPTDSTDGAHYFIDVLFAPSSSATSSPTPTPEPTPTPAPTPTPEPTPEPAPEPTPAPEPAPTPAPTGPPRAADFPTPTSVGPASNPTATYAGSCYVTTDNLVIDGKVVNCQADGLVISRDTTGVVIRNSVVNGGVFTEAWPQSADADNNAHATAFTVESSRVIGGPATGHDGRALGFAHFVVRDSYIQGSHSGMFAYNKAVVENSYITTDGTDTHQSGLRMLKNSTLRGNTIFCKPVAGAGQDGGCSADAVFYREFGVPGNLTIERNYFKNTKATSGQGPWFATRFIDCNATNDCLNITFTGNLFDLGQGTAASEFPNDAGDVWADNWWTDGTPAASGQSR